MRVVIFKLWVVLEVLSKKLPFFFQAVRGMGVEDTSLLRFFLLYLGEVGHELLHFGLVLGAVQLWELYYHSLRLG